MNRPRVYWSLATALVVATIAMSAFMYPKLPETIPTHWNLAGKVDGYGPKSVSLLAMPIMSLLMLGLFRALPVLSPKNFEVDTFRDTYLFILVVVLGMFAYLHAVILYATWQQVEKVAHPIDIGRYMIGGIFLFLAVMGNVLGKVRRNFWIGVRVPWTLASDRVWNDTHRLAAWTLVAGGLIGFVMTIAGLPILIAFAVLIVSVLIPVVYSFVHYKQLERRGEL
jgi:uncharacterized membrane protein